MYRVTLTGEQQEDLQRQIRQAGLAPSTRERLEMVRLAGAGWRVPQIARYLGQHEQTVRAWLKAFLGGGVTALANKPRGGQQSALTPTMLAALRDEMRQGQRTWTAAQAGAWLAERYGVRLSGGRLRVHLRRAKLSYQRTSRSLRHKQDPQQVAASTAVLEGLAQDAAAGDLDLCHLDEAGFGMTLPPSYSWFPQGERLTIPYEAAQGRRVNALGAYVSHGPAAGQFTTQTWATLPKSRAKKQRTTPAARAAAHGLQEEEVGPIDAERLVAFIWEVAQRPAGAPADWRRERPLVIVLDNYSVHMSQVVADTRAAWAAAGITVVYLPAYCPDLSAIEPVWNDLKQHHLPTRSYRTVAELKRAVDAALAAKATQLRAVAAKTTNLLQAAT